MKYIFFFVLNFSLSFALLAQPLYLPYRKGDKWGVYDTYKKEMVAICKYDSVGEVRGEFFPFLQNKLWGVLNTKGDETVGAKYNWLEANALQADNIPIRVKNNGKWGCISVYGEEYLPCQYDSLGSFFATDYTNVEHLLGDNYNYDGKFSEILGRKLNFITTDYAIFGKNNQYGVLNHTGKQTIPAKYDVLKKETDNLILAKKDRLWGVLRLDGKELIPVGYDSIVKIGEYDAKTQFILQYKGKWGLKNKEGHTILPFEYEEIAVGDVVKIKQNGKWGFADGETGKILLEPKYDYLYANFLRPQSDEDYSEGEGYEPPYEAVLQELLAKMGNDQAKLDAFMSDEKNQAEIQRLLDAKQEEIQKDMTVYEAEKYLKVKQKGKIGLITQEGKDVLACEYEDIMVFPYKNKFWVRQNKKWGLINRKGELLVPYQYDKFYRSTKAEMSGKWVLLEAQTGKPKQPCCDYEDIEPVDGRGSTYLKVKLKGKWGVVDNEGKLIVPREYTRILQFGDYFQVFKGKKFGYLDSNGKEVFRCEYEESKDEYSTRKEGKYGIFSYQNDLKVYIPFEYDTLYSASGYDYSDPNMIVVKNKKMGLYMDSILAIPCKYDSLKFFDEKNLTIWAKENGKWGMIQENGKTALPFDYQEIMPLMNYESNEAGVSYLLAKKGGKWGAITPNNNKEMMPFEYQNVIPLRNDSIIWVQKNNLWGMYSLRSKKTILPCQYDKWETWKMDNMYVDEMPSREVDSSRLQKVVKMSPVEANYIKVSKKGKWGVVLLESGMELIPCEYSQVIVNERDIFDSEDMQADIKAFRVQLNGKWGWADIFGKRYFE